MSNESLLDAPDRESPLEDSWRRSSWRVPRDDGAILAVPPLTAAAKIARRNGVLLDRCAAPILDRTVSQLRHDTRAELVSRAATLTNSWADADASTRTSATELIFVTGHQPELFHQGVWIKQLAVSALARTHGALGLNLIVDNDTLESTSIKVPMRTDEGLSVEAIPFDTARPAQPWEEARLQDRACFESFGERCRAAMQRWNIDPLMSQAWPHAVEHARHDTRLSACLTVARMRLERTLGYGNLELPMSHLCESTGFRRFALHLMHNAERLRATYNQVVAEYRRMYRLRSTSHPVPDLQQVDDWCEVPLWIWSEGATSRQRVFVKRHSDRFMLADRPDDSGTLAEFGTSLESAKSNLDQLAALSERGWRLRSRALMTTCFARLLLSDVFIHGIGGAKYDEITDQLMVRFFDAPVPSFITLSATMWLGIHESVGCDSIATIERQSEEASRWNRNLRIHELQSLRRQRRDTYHNAQRFLDPTESASIAALIQEKEALVNQQQASDHDYGSGVLPVTTTNAGYLRYKRLREINRLLAEATTAQRTDIQSRIEALERDLAAMAILNDREYAAWLYPASKLQFNLNL